MAMSHTRVNGHYTYMSLIQVTDRSSVVTHQGNYGETGFF